MLIAPHTFMAQRLSKVAGCRGFWWYAGRNRFYPEGPRSARPTQIRLLKLSCQAALGCMEKSQLSLAMLYAQSRPAMLPLRCLAATAGTSLVRGLVKAAQVAYLEEG